MNQPHEVIVYRNPVEYELWHSGLVAPIMCAMIVFFLSFLFQTLLFPKTRNVSWFFVFSGLLFVLTIYFMV